MINLDTTSRKLQVVLAGAKSTVDAAWTVNFQDASPAGGIGGGPPTAFQQEANGTTNGATAVDMVPAPPAGANLVRSVTTLTLFNADNAAITATIRINDNGTTRVLTTIVLQTSETLVYEQNDGFYCLDINGGIKSPGGATSSASSTADSKAVLASSATSSTASSTTVAESSASSQALSAGTLASAASSQAVSAGATASTASSTQSLQLSAGTSTTLSKTKSSFGF
ncbi:MAG: hypothetical protein JWM41_2901 [Gemmatimonadetes bacterium]|nr:hypothetical protein [Gemmatimonadota bacterium]